MNMTLNEIAIDDEMNQMRDRIARLVRERDELAAQLAAVREMYRSDHDQRIRQEEQIKQLNSEIAYLRSTDHAADLAFERTAPLDWRSEFNDETPLGQMLDGQGDEVEP